MAKTRKSKKKVEKVKPQTSKCVKRKRKQYNISQVENALSEIQHGELSVKKWNVVELYVYI